MADFIYNNFSNEPNNDDDWNEYNMYPQQAKRSKVNLVIVLVCAFFGILILMSSIFGFLIVNKLASGSFGNKSVDSMIFSSPTQTTISSNPTAVTPEKIGPNKYSTYTEVIYAVKDSVVEIKTQVVSNGAVVSESAGSGVIIGSYVIDATQPGYYIVTNAHVIETSSGTASDTITVKTTDGKEYAVTAVRGFDTYGDIAVLMVNTTDKLTGVEFGDSNSLVLGQEVIAIGNPLGSLGGTCTNGIISALDREIEIDGTTFNLLQTNAAINQGNSGGGLFDMNGKLIGIINAKSIGEGVEGIGFAIPSNDAHAIVEDIIEHGYVEGRPYIGVTVAQATDAYGTPYVYVHDLEEGFNDDVLKKQDIILSLNGTQISSLDDLRGVISKAKPYDTITAMIRRGTEYLTVSITVYEKTN